MKFSLGQIKDAFQKSNGQYESLVSNLIGSQDLPLEMSDLNCLFDGYEDFIKEIEEVSCLDT